MSTKVWPVKVESSHHGTRTTSLFRATTLAVPAAFLFSQQPPCIPGTDIIVLRNKVAVFSARDRHTRHVCDRHLQACIADHPGSRVPPTWFATSQRILSLISGAGLSWSWTITVRDKVRHTAVCIGRASMEGAAVLRVQIVRK